MVLKGGTYDNFGTIGGSFLGIFDLSTISKHPAFSTHDECVL